MTAHKRFQLGGLYHLTIDDLYEEDCLKDIKEELEAIHGVRLQKAATQYELVYVCKNGLTNNTHHSNNFQIIINTQDCRCGYYVRFSIQSRLRRQIYRLKSFNLKHLNSCSDSQQAAFLRNKRMLADHTDAIMKIVAFKRARGESCSNPKAILNILCDETGLSENFLYQGIYEDMYRRKLKKRLDNLIADARRVYIDPKLYLSPTQYKNLFTLAIPQITPEKIIERSCIKSPNLKKRNYGPRNAPQIMEPQKTNIQKQGDKGKQKRVPNLRSRAFHNLTSPQRPQRCQIGSATSLMSAKSEVHVNQINPQLITFPEEHLQTPKIKKIEPNQQVQTTQPKKEPEDQTGKNNKNPTVPEKKKSDSSIEQIIDGKRMRKPSRRLYDF